MFWGSIILSIYILIGFFITHKELNEIADMLEEELDEDDYEKEDLLELEKNKEQIGDKINDLKKLVGEKGAIYSFYVFGTLFWLPTMIYSKFQSK